MSVTGPAVPERNTAGAAGRMVILERVTGAAGSAQDNVGVPVDLEGQLGVDLRGDTKTMGSTTPLAVRQNPPERWAGEHPYWPGSSAQLLAEQADQSPGATGLVKSPALTSRSRRGVAVAAA